MNSEFCVAVHALVYLNHKACSLSSEALAENVCTNPARVRKVLSRLKKAGLVETREGADGGYRFVLPPEQVSLARIADALEVVFVSSAWRSGDQDMNCLVASGMADVMDGIFADLDGRCRERLKQITIQTIDAQIFGARKGSVSHEKI